MCYVSDDVFTNSYKYAIFPREISMMGYIISTEIGIFTVRLIFDLCYRRVPEYYVKNTIWDMEIK